MLFIRQTILTHLSHQLQLPASDSCLLSCQRVLHVNQKKGLYYELEPARLVTMITLLCFLRTPGLALNVTT